MMASQASSLSVTADAKRKRLEEPGEQKSSTSPISLADLLQAELDLLSPSSSGVAQHPQEEEGQHPLIQRNNELAAELLRLTQEEESTTTNNRGTLADADDEDCRSRSALLQRYDQELVESFGELSALHTVLHERIPLEQDRIRKLEETLEEYREIHRVLLRAAQKQQELMMIMEDQEDADATMDDDESTRAKRTQHPDDDLMQLTRQNLRLRDDLKYVTDRIQEQRPDVFATTAQGQSLLHDILWQLIDRRLRAEDENDEQEAEENSHPYVPLRVTTTNGDDEQDDEGTKSRLLLQLLRDEVRVVESYNDSGSDKDDDKLVCLVDYNATAAAPTSVALQAPADDDDQH